MNPKMRLQWLSIAARVRFSTLLHQKMQYQTDTPVKVVRTTGLISFGLKFTTGLHVQPC